MPERWQIRLGLGAAVLGVALAIAQAPEFGALVVLLGVYLVGQGVLRRRRRKQVDSSLSEVQDHRMDCLERLERGETFDQVAQEYDRLYRIPRARTLLYLGALFRVYVGVGRDPERNELAGFALKRQDVPAPEPPEKMIEGFSFANNVFFVDESARFYPDESKPDVARPGILLIARYGVYFFIDPARVSVEGEFAKGLVKEKLFDWTGVPYLSLASAGFETASALWEGLRDYFRPEVVERLKKNFGVPGSFALPLSAVVALDKLRLTRFGLPRERLVIMTNDAAGHETRYCFGSSRVFDNRWVTGLLELISTACVLNGRMLLY